MDCKDYRILRNNGEIIHGLWMYTVWTKPRVFFKYIINEDPFDYYEMYKKAYTFKTLIWNIFILMSIFFSFSSCHCPL